MKQKNKMITLPCDCNCCMLVVEKTVWEDGNVNYNISIQDSRYDHNYNTIFGRMKRAVTIYLENPSTTTISIWKEKRLFANLQRISGT